MIRRILTVAIVAGLSVFAIGCGDDKVVTPTHTSEPPKLSNGPAKQPGSGGGPGQPDVPAPPPVAPLGK